MTTCSAETHFNIPLIVRIKATRQCHKPQPFGRERRAEADSNRGPSALGQPGSLHVQQLTDMDQVNPVHSTAAASENVDQVLLVHSIPAASEDVLEMVLTDMDLVLLGQVLVDYLSAVLIRCGINCTPV